MNTTDPSQPDYMGPCPACKGDGPLHVTTCPKAFEPLPLVCDAYVAGAVIDGAEAGTCVRCTWPKSAHASRPGEGLVIDLRGEKPRPTYRFDPTSEEVAAYAVLAEVAGKTEREAVLFLAQRVYAAEQKNAASEAEVRAWCSALERGDTAEAARMEQSMARPQRPRVGPWVEDGPAIEARHDASGQAVGEAWEDGRGNWRGKVRRPFDAPLRIGWNNALRREEARAAVDAVLREHFDLDWQEHARAALDEKIAGWKAKGWVGEIGPNGEPLDVVVAHDPEEAERIFPPAAEVMRAHPPIDPATANTAPMLCPSCLKGIAPADSYTIEGVTYHRACHRPALG